MKNAVLLAWFAFSTPGRAASDFLLNFQKAASRKEPAERVEFYSRAIKAWLPSESATLLSQCHFGRGLARFETYQFDEAEPDLTRALDLDPGNSKAYLLRSKLFLRLRRHEAAVKDALEYVGRQPAETEGLLVLGQAHLQAGRGDAALRAFALAQKNERADERAWLGQARVFMARKDWRQAEQILDVADAKAGFVSADVLAERAACRVAQGRLEDGKKDYSGALPIYLRRLEEAQRTASHALETAQHQEDAARAFLGRGRVNKFLSLNSEAAADYRRACELGLEEACQQAEAMRSRAAFEPRRPLEKPQPAPKYKAAPRPEPKPARPAPRNERGDRIYGG